MLDTLTVELDSAAVDRLRQYCRAHGVTVAEVLADLIRTLPLTDSPEDEEWQRALPPIIRRLLGAASGEADEADYKEYLWKKYGPGA
ncbi:DUF6364 family protein [Longimicrobium sp.]|uniref:DUF6364 family protein n=1 Tax=Longimicrobium sp. TaxID=2029185 RepID=UPI002F9359EF